MTLEESIDIQLKKIDSLVDKFQQKSKILFYENMMYKVSDSLISILALSELKQEDSSFKIKNHISKINNYLKYVKEYEFDLEKKSFNINNFINNLISLINQEDSNLKIVSLISEIKSEVYTNKIDLEKILFNIFIPILLSINDKSELLLELRQKDNFALLTIVKDNFFFIKETIIKINKIALKSSIDLNIQNQGNGVEIIFRLPLSLNIKITKTKLHKNKEIDLVQK